MSKIGTKLPVVLLALTMAACFFTFAPTTAHADFSGKYEYEISSGTAQIIGYSGTETTVVIPGSLNGYTVTGIDYGAFYNNESIKDVTIPSSVTAIGDYAFARCTNLTTVTIFGPVTELGDTVFGNCSSLTNVILPGSLTTLGPHTFENCTGLSSITIPDGVTNIGLAVFDNCTSLTSIILPESLEEIGDYAFRGCGFTSFEIPLGVTNIWIEAFYGCGNLTRLSIPDSVKTIGAKVVDGCSGFSDIYYWGSEFAWQQMLEDLYKGIDQDNAVLRKATVHYNSIPSDYHRVRFSCAIYLYNMPDDQIVKDGKTVNKPANPSTGYYGHEGIDCTFGGWYSDKACTSVYDFSSPVTADMIIYAKMLTQIKFDANGHGTAPVTQTVRCGDKIQKPTDPQANGWEFDGWYTNADCTSRYDFDKIVTAPMTLYAKWVENTIVDISTCTIDSISAKTYTGSAIKPDPKVTLDGTILEKNRDYTIAYSNNINIGTATVTITGCGKYTGQITKNFEIIEAAQPQTDDNSTSTQTAAAGTILTDAAGMAFYSVTASGADAPYVAYIFATNKNAATITIPETVTISGVTYKITSIAPNVFKGSKKLKKVTIGANVEEIGKKAFYGCTNLTTVNCKSKVLKKIGASAFQGDKKLTKITLKSTLLKKGTVGKNAFKGTSKKLVIKVPAKAKKAYKKFFKTKGNKKVTIK